MKKYLLLLVLSFLFLNNVYADVPVDTTFSFPLYQYSSSDISSLHLENATSIISQHSQYSYYAVILNSSNNVLDTSDYLIIFFNLPPDPPMTTICETGGYSCLVANFQSNDRLFVSVDSSGNATTQPSYLSAGSLLAYQKGYTLYDTNYNFLSDRNIDITNFYSDIISISVGDTVPTYKSLVQYSSWSDYISQVGYTTVNLDDYEYVLLSLKNYNQSQPFQTNLQVKGQIGITPIYNYGQTSKDSITGVQVQDRCNLSYSDYTSYPFYIIQSDLNNNAIFAVKSCSSGSSFKFDNTIFDITYVTQSNLNDPTVTINGTTYHTIPYADLPSTATENEENNYIPGQSGSASDTGGLDSAIKNVQQKMSEIWNTFTYFTDFIGQLFSVLPVELKTILLSAFTIAIILGLIKIFIN